MFSHQSPAIHDDGMRIFKVCRAEDERCPMCDQMSRFRICAPGYDATCPCDRRRPVERQFARLNTKFAQALRELPQFGDPDQGLLGYSPIVESGATQAVTFDHCYSRP